MLLLGGFALKAQCTSPEGWDGRQYGRLCYNDIQALYDGREIDLDKFPYVDGKLTDDELVAGAIEYPVLTGLFMWGSGLLVDDFNDYLRVSALLLAPFALAIAWLLAKMTGRRALLWAAAPALGLYAFHNWDLLAVAAAVAAVWLWWRGREIPAAVAVGVGAALKLYPLLLLAPLVLYAFSRAGARRAAGVLGAGLGTIALLNLPFALINPEGWWATYEFHSNRTGNYDSIWTLGWPSLSAETLNLVTLSLTATFCLAALVWGWRKRDEAVYPFLPVAGALVAAFLLWNKVHSPQYTLWLLPFFVLLSVSLWWWVAYAVVDLAVYVGVFRWFFEYLYESKDFTFFKKLMIAGVWGRAVLLLALFVVFLRARPAVEGFLSQPPDTVDDVGDRLPRKPDRLKGAHAGHA